MDTYQEYQKKTPVERVGSNLRDTANSIANTIGEVINQELEKVEDELLEHPLEEKLISDPAIPPSPPVGAKPQKEDPKTEETLQDKHRQARRQKDKLIP